MKQSIFKPSRQGVLSAFTLLLLLTAIACGAKDQAKAPKYLFFLHNRFLESADLNDLHPEYGRCEYKEIISTFEKAGFTVISEKRAKDTDAEKYAKKVVTQIRDLLARGVSPSAITVVGTSKGGYIAMYVSSMLKNKDVSFAFIGCCSDQDPIPDGIVFHGNILSIYEQSDSFGRSCINWKKHSAASVSSFHEIMLKTGLKHGYLYKALDAWMQPVIRFGNKAPLMEKDLTSALDSIVSSDSLKSFNGIVLVSGGSGLKYGYIKGVTNAARTENLDQQSQFVIGSVSKQITAVLILRAYDKGLLQLHTPIRKYLPELKPSWADTVTVHHLLTHMHGIPETSPADFQTETFSKSLTFKPGTQFGYSQIGYHLLACIAARTSGKSFEVLSEELFAQCGMNGSSHPASKKAGHIAKGLLVEKDGTLTENDGLQNFVAAGGFISCADDLITWTRLLHHGKLLSDSTYRLMITRQPGAVRPHPIFGETRYGYGITVAGEKESLQLGQTGLTAGYASLCFYLPHTDTYIVVLHNKMFDPYNPISSLERHAAILREVKKSVLK